MVEESGAERKKEGGGRKQRNEEELGFASALNSAKVCFKGSMEDSVG